MLICVCSWRVCHVHISTCDSKVSTQVGWCLNIGHLAADAEFHPIVNGVFHEGDGKFVRNQRACVLFCIILVLRIISMNFISSSVIFFSSVSSFVVLYTIYACLPASGAYSAATASGWMWGSITLRSLDFIDQALQICTKSPAVMLKYRSSSCSTMRRFWTPLARPVEGSYIGPFTANIGPGTPTHPSQYPGMWYLAEAVHLGVRVLRRSWQPPGSRYGRTRNAAPGPIGGRADSLGWSGERERREGACVCVCVCVCVCECECECVCVCV
jgi:hypothetical protein